MKKIDVLIEQYSVDSDLCCVIDYDVENKMIIGATDVICTRKEAYKKYNVIGEIIDGKIRFLSSGDDDFEDENDLFYDDD